MKRASPEQEPLLTLAVGMAQAAFAPKGEAVTIGRLALPLSDAQRQHVSAFWATALAQGIPCLHVKDDHANAIVVVAYPTGGR